MAIDVYLQIDGIKGESQDSTHQGWIELASAQVSDSINCRGPHCRTLRAPQHYSNEAGRPGFAAADADLFGWENDPESQA